MGWRGDGSRGALALTRRHSESPPVQNGCTPLYVASYFGQLEAVKALVDWRADVEAKANVSSTGGTHTRTHTHTHKHTHTHTHTHTQTYPNTQGEQHKRLYTR
jgi:predicted LPLAT superfamily acyltransferase